MPWFQKLCRDSGLMIHNIMKPDHRRKVVKKKVEQKQVSDQVTLRRTTIEEIEVKQPAPPKPDDNPLESR